MTPTPLDPVAAAALFRAEAQALGFARIGFTPVAPVARHAVFRDWLARGYAAEMRYLDEQSDERRDARALLAPARTIVTVALSYAHADPDRRAGRSRLARGPRGRIARYARGDDYHVVLKNKLRALAAAVARAAGRRGRVRRPASTPRRVLERELAVGRRHRLPGEEHDADRARPRQLRAPRRAARPTSSARPAPRRRRHPALRRSARAASTPARPAPSSTPTRSTRAAASRTSRSKTPAPSRASCARSSATTSSAATSARRSARSTRPTCKRRAPPAPPELAPRAGYARPVSGALLGLGAAQFRKWQRARRCAASTAPQLHAQRRRRPRQRRRRRRAARRSCTRSASRRRWCARTSPGPSGKSPRARRCRRRKRTRLSSLFDAALARETDDEVRVDLRSGAQFSS